MSCSRGSHIVGSAGGSAFREASRSFGAETTAAGVVEYALIVGLISVLAVGALATFRGALSSSVENSASQLEQALGG